MDVRMPNVDGIRATAEICAASDTKVLVLTTFDLDEYVYDALRAGASGFLLKDMRRDELVNAVRVVAGGRGAARADRDPPAHRRRGDPRPRAGPGAAGRAPKLGRAHRPGDRDAEAVARGMSNAEIAAELYVTEHTVKTHVSNVLTKLGLRDRVQAVVLAYETGLVVPRSGE